LEAQSHRGARDGVSAGEWDLFSHGPQVRYVFAPQVEGGGHGVVHWRFLSAAFVPLTERQGISKSANLLRLAEEQRALL
jgi:hypothetical protein